MITGADGMPRSMVDLARIQSDATRLMYAMAAASGNDAELDAVVEQWADSHDPDEFGYIAAGALSMLVRCIVEPMLQVIDEVLPAANFRGELIESRDHAERTLGGAI
ncbi:hypothetical protein ACWDNI_16095 [Nocardia niigatensis]